jgi:hypothetical protein
MGTAFIICTIKSGPIKNYIFNFIFYRMTQEFILNLGKSCGEVAAWSLALSPEIGSSINLSINKVYKLVPDKLGCFA